MGVAEQGALDTALLDTVLAGKRLERKWMTSEVAGCVEEIIRETAAYPRTKAVAAMLARRIAALANEKAMRSLERVPVEEEASSVRLTDPVLEIALRARQRGTFRGWSELIEGFIRYWALAQGDLTPMAQILAMEGPARDRYDAELLAGVIAGAKTKGSWLKHEIYVATDEWTRDHLTDPSTQEIALKVREKMMQMAKGTKPA